MLKHCRGVQAFGISLDENMRLSIRRCMLGVIVASLSLSGSAARAQMVASANTIIMPAGSTDRYVGVGVFQAPKYVGGKENTVAVGLDYQVNWSNGVFISGANLAGMHLSNEPSIEYGPLIEYQAGREATDSDKLRGLQDIPASFNVGAFYNYDWNEHWRFTSSLMHATNDAGMYMKLGVQRSFAGWLPSHNDVIFSFGITAANSYYNQKYFGISPGMYAMAAVPLSNSPSGGIKDVHGGIRWNWELSPSWLLVTDVSTSYLTKSAGDSPLVEKRNYTTFATGIAYRF